MAIPAVVYLAALIAGAGLQYKAQSDAQSRQRREIEASLMRQNELQKQAEGKALQHAQTYAPEQRQQEQVQLAQEIEQNLMQPVSESQQIRAQQATTQGEVSQDYTTAKARADLETVKQAEQLARLLGKTSSAGRLRMNEGIRLGDVGQEIGMLGNFSRGQQGADNIAIQQAGNVNPGQMFMGSVLQSVGGAGLAYGGSLGGGAATGGNWAPVTGGMTGSEMAAANGLAGGGLKAGSGMGLRPGATGIGLKF